MTLASCSGENDPVIQPQGSEIEPYAIFDIKYLPTQEPGLERWVIASDFDGVILSAAELDNSLSEVSLLVNDSLTSDRVNLSILNTVDGVRTSLWTYSEIQVNQEIDFVGFTSGIKTSNSGSTVEVNIENIPEEIENNVIFSIPGAESNYRKEFGRPRYDVNVPDGSSDLYVMIQNVASPRFRLVENVSAGEVINIDYSTDFESFPNTVNFSNPAGTEEGSVSLWIVGYDSDAPEEMKNVPFSSGLRQYSFVSESALNTTNINMGLLDFGNHYISYQKIIPSPMDPENNIDYFVSRSLISGIPSPEDFVSANEEVQIEILNTNLSSFDYSLANGDYDVIERKYFIANNSPSFEWTITEPLVNNINNKYLVESPNAELPGLSDLITNGGINLTSSRYSFIKTSAADYDTYINHLIGFEPLEFPSLLEAYTVELR